MFKKQHLALAIAATLAAGSAQAALETSVTLKNETAYMTSDSIRTGEGTTSTDTTGEGKGVYKFENTAQIFLNDDLGNGTSWHGELKIVRDSKAIGDYDGHEAYTQQDWLRELYADTTAGDWDLRIGKQQVVWGTADGIKLLDMVNPTDWREFNQNTMADARIPVFMINAEKYLDNGSNLQLILAQAGSHEIAGLGDKSATGTSHSNGKQGHPFVMKGVDTITGQVNGFLNIAPAMGAVATTFGNLGNATAMSQADVDDFITNAGGQALAFTSICSGGNMSPGSGSATSASCMNAVVNTLNLEATGGNGYGTNNAYAQNLFNNTDAAGTNTTWNAQLANPTEMFSYMPDATFATFVSFEGMTSEYRVDKPADFALNPGFRWRNTTANGLNYSVNYFYHYDSNPYITTHWEDTSGAKYSEVSSTDGTDTGTYVTSGEYVTNTVNNAAGNLNLVFTEKHKRIHSLGGSFDYAIDSGSAPIVIRGEFVYDKNTMQPVITRHASNGVDLNHGFFTSSLVNEEADFFKYVIGADTTIMTDMMLSGQFIQFRNLDYIDVGNSSAADWRYTGDTATMHLTNGLKKAEENKNFYSVFLSKPFGESGEGRWNNIFIYEEGGGKWNRFDIEYGFDDQLIGTFEVNKYFGDNNTTFGQFENASNIQVGIKYLLQ